MKNPEQHKFEKWLIDQRDNHEMKEFHVSCANEKDTVVVNQNTKRILAGGGLTEIEECKDAR